MVADKMTPEQALALMEDISADNSGDPEADHGKADDILLAVIRFYGHDDLADAFGQIDKWYA